MDANQKAYLEFVKLATKQNVKVTEWPMFSMPADETAAIEWRREALASWPSRFQVVLWIDVRKKRNQYVQEVRRNGAGEWQWLGRLQHGKIPAGTPLYDTPFCLPAEKRARQKGLPPLPIHCTNLVEVVAPREDAICTRENILDACCWKTIGEPVVNGETSSSDERSTRSTGWTKEVFVLGRHVLSEPRIRDMNALGHRIPEELPWDQMTLWYKNMDY